MLRWWIRGRVRTRRGAVSACRMRAVAVALLFVTGTLVPVVTGNVIAGSESRPAAAARNAVTAGIAPTSARAGTVVFAEDFSTDPNINGRWTIYRSANNDTANEVSWDATQGVVHVVRPVVGRAAALFARYDLTSPRWEAEFRYRIGGGASPGDGLVFMFFKDRSPFGPVAGGGALGFRPNDGSLRAGYGIEFDAHQNPEFGGEPATPHIALIQDYADRPGSHLATKQDNRAADGLWHTALIGFDQGRVSISIDQTPVLSHTLTAPSYAFTGVGFSAGTGADVNDHVIDSVILRDLSGLPPSPTATPTHTSVSTPTRVPSALGALRFITPVRVVDTRPESGPIGFQPGGLFIAPGPLAAGTTTRYAISGRRFGGLSFPADVTGLLLNVTVVTPSPRGGYVTVFPGDLTTPPTASTVNPTAAIAHNFWVTGIPTRAPFAGTIGVFTTEPLDLVLDVVGYYSPSQPDTVGSLRFVTPVRVLDTRPDPASDTTASIGYDSSGARAGKGPLRAETMRQFRIAGQTFGTGSQAFRFPDVVTGVLAHLTVVGGSGGGFVTLLPGDAAGRPGTSTVNPVHPISFNSWAVGLPASGGDAGTVKVYVSTEVEMIVDVVAFYSPLNAPAGDLTLIPPVRVVDTRGGQTVGFSPDGTAITPGPFAARGETRRYRLAGATVPDGTVPPNLTGVLLNVTIVQAGASGGFVTAFPGDVPDGDRPTASTVNPSTSIAASFWANGLPTTGPFTGTEAIYATHALHVVVDVVGYFR